MALRILHSPRSRVKYVPRGTFDGTLAAQLQKGRVWMFHAGDNHLWPGRLCRTRSQLDDILLSEVQRRSRSIVAAPTLISPISAPERPVSSRAPDLARSPSRLNRARRSSSWSGLVRIELQGAKTDSTRDGPGMTTKHHGMGRDEQCARRAWSAECHRRLNHWLLAPLVASRFHFHTDSQRVAAAALRSLTEDSAFGAS